MRRQFCDALVGRSSSENLVFLTGDLGFMALEDLKSAMGERFINAGVAEQNMLSVSAALARQGFEVWAYSIAPFCYARAFEQIRNDVALHNLPVRIVGNGGGYGYGVMGPTHHAIEDYGILLTLSNMSAFIPAFDADVQCVVDRAALDPGPCYLRLGRGEQPSSFAVPPYKPWRQLVKGDGVVVIVIGPIVGSFIEPFLALPEAARPNLWVVSELPIERAPIPSELFSQLQSAPGLCVIEEHVAHGGFAGSLLLHLARAGVAVANFQHHAAKQHNFGIYGSQKFMRQQSMIDPRSIVEQVQLMTPAPSV